MDFYFNRKSFEKKIKLLTYLLNTTNYLLLITGIKNSGKTQFVETWLSNKLNLNYNDLNNLCISKISLEHETDIDLDYIKEHCITNWQLNVDQNFTINFKDVINNIPKQSMYQYVLLIDNAERLPKNILQELIELNSNNNSLLFRLVLVGEISTLNTTMELLKEKSHKYYNSLIKPLSFRETRLFLIELYRKHNKTVPFNFNEVKKIYQNSLGLMPNIIKEIKKSHVITKKYKKEKFGFNFFGNNFKNLFANMSLGVILEYKYALKNISIAFLGLIILGLFIFQEEINNNLLDNGANLNTSITSDASAVSIQVSNSEVMKANEIQEEIQKNKINTKAENLSDNTDSNMNKVISKSNVNITKNIKNTEDSIDVLKLDNDNYTIQLGAYLKKQDATDFINKNINNHSLRKKFKIVAAQRNNDVYYLVLYGDYETRQSANNYVKILKNSLKSNGPWIRQIASVKDDISSLKLS